MNLSEIVADDNFKTRKAVLVASLGAAQSASKKPPETCWAKRFRDL
jgi:hypothetical protein